MPNPRGGSFHWFVGGGEGCGDYGFRGNPRNTMGHVPNFLKPRQVYTTRVEVRNGSVRGLVNGNEMLGVDFSNLGNDEDHRLPDERCLGLVCDDPTVFYHVRVVEVTGKGKEARE